MFGWLIGTSKVQRTAEALYDRIVTAARNPELYGRYAVADDAEGRFEMVALHLFLTLEGLKASSEPQDFRDAVTQRVIETFVTDMDDCMREMGVGDLTVPKRVKRAAAGFYERAGHYRAALDATSDDLMTKALVENVYADGPGAERAASLAIYTRQALAILKGKTADTILSDADLARLRNLTAENVA